jgi:hypothetical protein
MAVFNEEFGTFHMIAFLPKFHPEVPRACKLGTHSRFAHAHSPFS